MKIKITIEKISIYLLILSFISFIALSFLYVAKKALSIYIISFFNSFFIFYLIISLIIAIYQRKNYNSEKLIYDEIENSNRIYHLHFFFIDLWILFKKSPKTFIISLIFIVIMIKTKIVLLIMVKPLMSFFWTIHYFCYINTYKKLNMEFALSVDLSDYNYFWLSKKKIIDLIFIKIPKLNGFLVNYFIFSEEKKKNSKDFIKKKIYYIIFRIPMRLIHLIIRIINLNYKIIENTNWEEKKKKRWIAIMIYKLKWEIPKEISKDYSYLIFISKEMRIYNKKVNNLLDKALGIILWSYCRNKSWKYTKFNPFYNSIRNQHCTLRPEFVENKAKLETIAISKTHSEEIRASSIKIEPFKKEINIEEKGLNEQYSYLIISYEDKFSSLECSNSFLKNNSFHNQTIIDIAKKRDIILASSIINGDTFFLDHRSEKKEIIQLKNIKIDKLNKFSRKFLEEENEITNSEIDNVINLVYKNIDEKERLEIKNKIIKTLKVMSNNEIKEFVIKGGKEMDDIEFLKELNKDDDE